MRALREAWISLGIGNRNDSASGLEAGGGMGAGRISDGDRGREWGRKLESGGIQGWCENIAQWKLLGICKGGPSENSK